ncbi:MAG: adenine deaminase [Lactobacillaceae bacterium]|jgi:adenine deaminase|nr:adenine deaminase [Lactobacillaceae bacterium]
MTTQVKLHIANGQVFDVFNQCFEQTDLWIDGDSIFYRGKSDDLTAETTFDAIGKFIVPGLIDAHMHVESSYLVPSQLGAVLAQHGVTRIFADPHEIANVAGVAGIQFMIDDARQSPIHIHYMLPSSVPAASFEHNGATLTASDLKPFYSEPEIAGLAEVMDFPAVANANPDMLAKINDAIQAGKHADGHGAGLTREQLAVYRRVGIDTDHEATNQDEALDRLAAGMHVLIREGTVERDEKEVLKAVNPSNSRQFSFCTDDKTVHDLLSEGSIDLSLNLALQNGLSFPAALTMATYNAAIAHRLENVGALTDGYVADLVILDSDENFHASQTMVAGEWFNPIKNDVAVAFPATPLNFTLAATDLVLPLKSDQAHVIQVIPHHITTEHQITTVPVNDAGKFVPDEKFNKITVIERYHDLGNSTAIISGIGLREGAIGTTISHDSHNIMLVGVDDAAMLKVAETLKEMHGGLVVVDGTGNVTKVALPIGGLITNKPYALADQDIETLQKAFQQISDIEFDPFLTLSFMALPVIPSLKITDQGLFDFDKFDFIDINA